MDERGRWCKRCQYPLQFLQVDRCPECGQPFDPGRPLTFLREPVSPRRGHAPLIGLLTGTAVAAAGLWLGGGHSPVGACSLGMLPMFGALAGYWWIDRQRRARGDWKP